MAGRCLLRAGGLSSESSLPEDAWPGVGGQEGREPRTVLTWNTHVDGQPALAHLHTSTLSFSCVSVSLRST